MKVAVSGEKAPRIATSAEPPDLILFDTMHPGCHHPGHATRLPRIAASGRFEALLRTGKADASQRVQLARGLAAMMASPVDAVGAALPDRAAALERHVRRFEFDSARALVRAALSNWPGAVPPD